MQKSQASFLLTENSDNSELRNQIAFSGSFLLQSQQV